MSHCEDGSTGPRMPATANYPVLSWLMDFRPWKKWIWTLLPLTSCPSFPCHASSMITVVLATVIPKTSHVTRFFLHSRSATIQMPSLTPNLGPILTRTILVSGAVPTMEAMFYGLVLSTKELKRCYLRSPALMDGPLSTGWSAPISWRVWISYVKMVGR